MFIILDFVIFNELIKHFLCNNVILFNKLMFILLDFAP